MRSAVWLATLRKYHKLADLLVRSGVDVTKPIGSFRGYDHGATLLHLAAESGKLRRVKLLLRHGADANARDSRGKTALHYAVARDHADVAEMLVTAGADVNARDDDGLTTLHVAVLKLGENATRLLLEKGADVDAADSRGWNALHLAVLIESIRLAEVLLRHGITVDMRDMLMWTPLHFALNNSKEHMIQLLLHYGADVNSKSKDGYFPLYYAVATDSLSIVKLLLTKGANVHEKTGEGETVLHVACKRGLVKVTNVLLDFKADVNIKDGYGSIALVSIAERNCDTAKIMIKHIAKLAAKSAFINDENWEAIKIDLFFQQFYYECCEEIEKMKMEKVSKNCNISYYYIFSRNEDKLATLMRNKDLVTALESSDYADRFSLYAQDLKTKFAVAIRRRNFLYSMETYLNSVFCFHIPSVVIQKIVAYLKFDDFNVINGN